MTIVRAPRRSARGSYPRSVRQDASATAFAGTDPRVNLRTTVLGRSPARTVWGNRLRMNTLRFRPADMRVAASRSTWCRRCPAPPPATTTTRNREGSRVAAATPTSRSFVLASLRALHLDPEAPPPAHRRSRVRSLTARAPNPPPHTIRRPLDMPFHVRLLIGQCPSDPTTTPKGLLKGSGSASSATDKSSTRLLGTARVRSRARQRRGRSPQAPCATSRPITNKSELFVAAPHPMHGRPRLTGAPQGNR